MTCERNIPEAARKGFDRLFFPTIFSLNYCLPNVCHLFQLNAHIWYIKTTQILVTNQVTTRFRSGMEDDEGRKNVTPVFGNFWSHCVNVRLVVQYVDTESRMVIILFKKHNS